RRVGNTDKVTFASTGKQINAQGGFVTQTATPGNHDIWQADPLGPSPGVPFVRLTGDPAGQVFDDREPAWNEGNGTSRYFGNLAFSSLGRTGTTRNIYWIVGSQLPENPGVTIAHQLQTPDNDPQVPVALHDKTDESSPSWSLGINSIDRIAHHANRLRS